MIRNIIAKRYSNALVETFQSDELKLLENEVEILANFLRDNKQIEEFLISPVAENRFKKEVLEKLAEGLKISDRFNDFLKVLVDADRIFFLKDICYQIIRQIHQRLNIYDFQLLTAYPIDSETSKKIKEFVKIYVSGEVHLKHNIDKRIKGGFLVYNENLAINASIASSLLNFKREF